MATYPALKIWVLGPYPLLNQSLASLVSGLPGLESLGQSETFNLDQENQPDLILQILSSPDDLTSFRDLRQNFPTQRVVLFTLAWTPAQARAALQSKAAGCLSADMQVEAFAAALRQAARGEIALPAGLQQALILEMTQDAASTKDTEIALSTREKEVIGLVIEGLGNKAIAQKLYLSVRTVDNHLARIYQKMGVSTRTEAAVLALQEGWLETD